MKDYEERGICHLQKAEVQARRLVKLWEKDVNLGVNRFASFQRLQWAAFHGPFGGAFTNVGVEPFDELVEMLTITNRYTEGMRCILFLEVNWSCLRIGLLGHITLSKVSC